MGNPRKIRLRNKIAYHIARHFPMRFRLSDLETMSSETIMDFGELSVIPAFQNAAQTLPFYKKILQEKCVHAAEIRTLEDFFRLVPILRKTDIFPVFTANDICQNGKIDDMRSSIVTSGTSGIFAYGLLTAEDAVFQQKMIDAFFDYYFDANNEPPLIINALAMGVSFASSYPVINTSVRSDIVIHLIKTFHSFYKKIIIICDPNFAKKIVEDGSANDLPWKTLPVSFITGGAWFPNSLAQYIISRVHDGTAKETDSFLGTMGLTEIALNIFSAPSELIAIRNIVQNDNEILHALFGEKETVCPEIMYYYPTRTYIEITDSDNRGRGNITISNLDTKTKTPLFRYDTGDSGEFVDRDALRNLLHKKGHVISPKLQLPLIAIFERGEGSPHPALASVAEVKEALFRTAGLASCFTGHFRIRRDAQVIEVQLEKNIRENHELQVGIETNIKDVSGKQCAVKLIPYDEFSSDVGLDYERKWKHIS